MLWGLFLGCISSGFERPSDPDRGTTLGAKVGVDPFTGQVWAARVQADTLALAELEALQEQEERSEEEELRMGVLFEQVMYGLEEYVFRIDPDRSYSREHVGTYLGAADAKVHFGASGPVLGSYPVDAEGRATSERRQFGVVDGQGRFQATQLVASPDGQWFLAGSESQILLSSELQVVSTLRGQEWLQWSPQSSLVAFSETELRFYNPRSQALERSVPIRILEPGVVASRLVAISPDEQQFLFTTVWGEGEEARKGTYLLDQGSGLSVPLSLAFRRGLFTAEGLLYAQDGQWLRIRERSGMERSYQVEAGAVWVDDQGLWAVYEEVGSWGYRSLVDGRVFAFNGNLRDLEIIQDTLWVRVEDAVFPIELATGATGRVVSDCTVSDINALPEGILVVRCDEDWSAWTGDEDGVADESLLFVNGTTGELIHRVWL